MRGLTYDGYFPFCVREAQLWDGSTYFGGQWAYVDENDTESPRWWVDGAPSGSASELDANIVGTGTANPIGFTLEELATLYWRTKQLEIELSITCDPITFEDAIEVAPGKYEDLVVSPWSSLTGKISVYPATVKEQGLVCMQRSLFMGSADAFPPVYSPLSFEELTYGFEDTDQLNLSWGGFYYSSSIWVGFSDLKKCGDLYYPTIGVSAGISVANWGGMKLTTIKSEQGGVPYLAYNNPNAVSLNSQTFNLFQDLSSSPKELTVWHAFGYGGSGAPDYDPPVTVPVDVTGLSLEPATYFTYGGIYNADT